MIQTEAIQYTSPESGKIFEGFICWDTTTATKKPGVLVAHTFRGQSQFEINKAKELAELGYVGFAIDMYGKGRRANTPEEAQLLMDELNADRPLLLHRIILALNTLQNKPQVDAEKIGAIGFCFGGKCVLDLARSNAILKGVASFHGVYDAPKITYSGPIKASILILHGWEDPLGTPAQLEELAHELTKRQADWQILAFGHTGHAFTNPQAQFPKKGMFYQKSSNNRAWKAMANFFEDIFG
ncbi:MAG: dienelactone hydrolase family protein [Maribacter sp.]|nr:dienelactone hydrolase family protein [Maribacter sp.]